MTDAEVAAAAAEIRALLDAGRPGDGFREIGERVARQDALRRALAREYGRRRGWTLAEGPDGLYFFDYARLLDRRLGHDERVNDRALPWLSRCRYGYLAGRRPVAFVAHRHWTEDAEVLGDMVAWGRERGLAVCVPAFPPWEGADDTTLVLFVRPEAIPPEERTFWPLRARA